MIVSSAEIGRVVEVHGASVKIQLDPGHRSAVRATLDGADTHIKINAYVTFDLGAGDSVLGVITDLYEREMFEPSDGELSLELVKPRRIATAQLLGTLRSTTAGLTFDPGVNVLPTLETPAVVARAAVLKTVVEDCPSRNRPSDHSDDIGPFDAQLYIGSSTAARERRLTGSYNDLFSRPLAVVGNTGSGKSSTIAHLLQEAIRTIRGDGPPSSDVPHFFVIDINGEYARAFGKKEPPNGKDPNVVYVNGKPFGVPVWLMNAFEVCQWLSAAEQVQEPALKQFWAIAKSTSYDESTARLLWLSQSLTGLDNVRGILGTDPHYKGQKVRNGVVFVRECMNEAMDDDDSTLRELLEQTVSTMEEAVISDFALQPVEEKRLVGHMRELREALVAELGATQEVFVESADKPLPIELEVLGDPKRLADAANIEGAGDQFSGNLRGLQLRLANRLSDKRWACFKNYEDEPTVIDSAEAWLRGIGVSRKGPSRISIIDCSMLAHEVLPYVCGIIGRMLLEVREYVPAQQRFHEPWVIVLEEAHNYVCPPRVGESKGVSVSRQTFERIAKEGRKFGLSLIVASQRPSDISATVLSQCANFITHRLQNPDDIEHFRKIVPSQSRRLLDQITILAAGEGIALGSAFNVPMRVQVQKPNPEPSSESSSPFLAWKSDSQRFRLDSALDAWGVNIEEE